MRTPIVPPLPNPSDVATRQREQAATLSQATGARLLIVSALEDGMVVLMEADGTVIDETIPWIGAFDPVVGDKTIRLTIPGRGSKHAAPAYVAIGPVKASALTGRSMTVGDITATGHIKTAGSVPAIAAGSSAGTGATASILYGNDTAGQLQINMGAGAGTGIIATVTFNVPRDSVNYSVLLFPADSDAADLSGKVHCLNTDRTAALFKIRAAVAPTSSASHVWDYLVIE